MSEPSTATSGKFNQAPGSQKKLPWSKAIEISFKSVKIRFWRSLITASGVVLAIAFLMATLSRREIITAIKDELPARIRGTRERLKTAKDTLQETLDAALKAGRPLEALNAPIAKSDFAPAQKQLDTLLAEKAGLGGTPEVAAFQSRLRETLATAEDLQACETFRLDLLKQGEAVALEGKNEQSDRDQADARARDTWLMVLALLVALVGIANAMLMAVTERFREIGTMKCLGALDNFIVKLFLIESSMQGLLGTLLGITLGALLCIGKLLLELGPGMAAYLPWRELAGSAGISILIGTLLAVVGALYPVYVAAKMEPVVAMRVDQ